MDKPTLSRNPAMDVIRCFALFCVVGVHFFLYTGFESETVTGIGMYFKICMHNALMICVPLFLLLSGYLMLNKRPTRQYYGKLAKTLFIYLAASICCGAYSAYAAKTFWNETVSIADLVLGIFSFSTAPYAWYIEMYIGLFLLIPYLNILYANLGSQRSKQYLLLTLLFLTALPCVVNVYNFTEPGWWLSPNSSDTYQAIMPDWWVGIYPITYYFLGAYLREYPLKIKAITNLLLAFLSCLAISAYDFYRSHGGTYVYGWWTEHYSLFFVILSVLVFNLLSQLRYNWMGTPVRKVLALLSDLCLGAYLVSWIFDQQVYGSLADLVPQPEERLRYFLPVVLTVYFRSLCLSAVILFAYRFLAKLVSLLRRRDVSVTK